ncbi:Transferrin binding protein-like solute binding protein [Neisseria subflava]|nr:Transferrin binding protein-like solute binding protein [Neisseria subflava]
MSNIQTKLKTIVFTAVSAAILSACGGGGGGSAALRTGSTPTNNTGNGNTPKTPSPKLTNRADKLDELIDEAPIEPANVPQPLHTHFISSEGAQQSNPNVQLRERDDKTLYQTDNQNDNQNGLISSIDFKKHDEVKIDGGMLFNKTPDGNASQPTWSSPSSLTTKVNSKGKTQTDTGELAEKNKKASENLAYFRLGQDGLVFDTQFDGVYVISFDDNTQIVLHDPSAAGWTYQTFAHYTVPDKTPHKGYQGYQSLGDETAFATLPAKGTATYKGISTAYVVTNNDNRQLTSNVMAIVDFGLKGVRFETSNSHFHTLKNDKRVSEAAENYNFKGTASWKDGNIFLGKVSTADGKLSGNLSGKFYGPNAAEIGGTYGLKTEDATEHLIGGYGAKRK